MRLQTATELFAAVRKAVFKGLNLADSTSPSIRHAAEEPENWRQMGETSVERAIKNSFNKHDVKPSDYR